MDSTGLEYDVVDVFADAPFSGNQLAVVHGAAGLGDAQLLALTREFGFSETTFPAPLDDASYAVRIFTPGGEIPFAGHPTLGTAWALRARGVLADPEPTQVCDAGRIAVRFTGSAPDAPVELSVPPGDLAGPLPDHVVGALLEDLGLGGADRDGEAWIAGTGLDFVHVPVVADALARARAPRSAITGAGEGLDLAAPMGGVNLVAVSRPGGAGSALAVRARVFVPGLAVPEDPATGSAAAGLGLALVARGLLPDGGGYEISQGVELGRPSRLLGRVEAAAGVAIRVHVAGRVFPVAHGTVAVPGA